MKNATATAFAPRCLVACAFVFFASAAHADSINIRHVAPYSVQPGQTLYVDLGVGYDSGTKVAFPCPLTLTPMGGTTPLLSVPASVPPARYNITIPATAPMGTYILQWTCANGLSATAPSPVTISAGPTIQDFGPSPAPSGSDQMIQGSGFSNTQGKGYVFLFSPQNSFQVRKVASWSDNEIHYTLPVVPPGTYLLSVQTDSNGSSMTVQFPITPPVLQGWVDLHTHPLANLGFGGKLFYGNVDFDRNLGVPNGSNGGPCVPIQALVNSIPAAIGPENWVHGPGSNDNPCGDTETIYVPILVNQTFSIRDEVIHLTQTKNVAQDWNDTTYTTSGYPGFPTWPTWDDITHQKMWVDWIRRSFDGGMSVMVALAVNTKTLGDLTVDNGDLPTDDMRSADIQIQEIKNFVARHSDWMQVAYSSAEVYNILSARSRKLAVVIGVEINNIGNLGVATNSNRNFQPVSASIGPIPISYNLNTDGNVPLVPACALVSEVDRLYDEGVRYIFPIHLADNPIGGTAVYQDIFNLANVYEEGHSWNLTCSKKGDNIGYTYTSTPTPSFPDPTAIGELWKLGFVVSQPPPAMSCPKGSGDVNAMGLTPEGRIAIQEMMKKGMLIDVDHMSQAAATQTISLAQCAEHYPLNSGHNRLRKEPGVEDVTWTERNLTADNYKSLGQLHGMAGVGSVGLDACSWMNAYNAIIQAMGTNEMGIAGFGTDQVLAMGMPPRLNTTGLRSGYGTCLDTCENPLKTGACSAGAGGPDGPACLKATRLCATTCTKKWGYVVQASCNTKAAPSNVQYNAAFPMSSLGTGTPWDYNTVGVAHYGMLPDFLKDVETLPGKPISNEWPQGSPSGATVASRMMFGAQYFYQTWRNAENAAAALNAALNASSSNPITSCLQTSSNSSTNNCRATAVCPSGTVYDGACNMCLAPRRQCPPTCPPGENYVAGSGCLKPTQHPE
jgi:hypothetical protein